MANLTEDYQWPDGIHQWEEEEFIEGGPDGPDNVPPRQLANRARFLSIQELILSDIAGMGVKEASKTIRQRIQEGSVTIYNRGVKSGCAAVKAGSARKVTLPIGVIFAKGLEMPCPGSSAGIVVPTNTSGATQVYYGYLTVGTNYSQTFALTGAGAIVPSDGIPICRLTVPTGSTAADLSDMTLTDVRRVESAYPTLVNSIPYASVALPFNMIANDYGVLIDVAGYAGGWNQRPGVYASEKASNGFKIYADGTLDEVNVLWKAVKMIL
jgi:hypothetical protein